MRVLLIGSGGREHALAWKIRQSPLVKTLLSLPGSDAMEAVAERVTGVAANDPDAVADAAASPTSGRASTCIASPKRPSPSRNTASAVWTSAFSTRIFEPRARNRKAYRTGTF